MVVAVAIFAISLSAQAGFFVKFSGIEGDRHDGEKTALNEPVARYRGATTYDRSFSATMTAVAAGPPSVKSLPATIDVKCGVRGNKR